VTEKEDRNRTRDDALFALLQEGLRRRSASPAPLSKTLPSLPPLSEEDIIELENQKKEYEEFRNRWRAWWEKAKENRG